LGLKIPIGRFWASGLSIDFRFSILDFRFSIEDPDWEVLGVRAIDFGFSILDFGLKRGIGRFWAGLRI
jgi:hypothetical protein